MESVDKMVGFMKHTCQREDGVLEHYVVFGNVAPWDAVDSQCVKCSSENDADKLIALLREREAAI